MKINYTPFLNDIRPKPKPVRHRGKYKQNTIEDSIEQNSIGG